ncbi:hypothetical protein, partial [Denitromonas sp.]|uniref:hypothetical protein n=1 Tax=Denitromonas sp. TaxID=2734609 RepID=UPI003A8C7C0D
AQLATIGRDGEQRVFWGCQGSQGSVQSTVSALILMGDWCAASRNHTPRTKCAALTQAGHGRDRMRDETQV